MHILDNECSAEFKERIKSNNMKYQLVPPHDHRWNIAKKVIQVFKAHFISILCGADKSFPLHLWDRLLGQAEHTLNMLTGSHPSWSTFLWYCNVSKKNKGFKILVGFPLKMKAKPSCTPPFFLPLTHHLIMEVCQPPLVFMSEH